MGEATPSQRRYLRDYWKIDVPCSQEQASDLLSRLLHLRDDLSDSKAFAEIKALQAAAASGADIDGILAVPETPRVPGEYEGFIIEITSERKESLSHKESRTTTARVRHPTTGEVLFTEEIRDVVNDLRRSKPGDISPSDSLTRKCHQWIHDHGKSVPI